MCMAEANYIVQKTIERNATSSSKVFMSPKRLQKILFFSDVQYMILNNGEPMFTDTLYAWDSGPVVPSVYYRFNQYKNGALTPINDSWKNLDSKKKKAIDLILNRTWSESRDQLIEESHIAGGPWSSAYDENDGNHNQEIKVGAILEFYSKPENHCKYIQYESKQ